MGLLLLLSIAQILHADPEEDNMHEYWHKVSSVRNLVIKICFGKHRCKDAVACRQFEHYTRNAQKFHARNQFGSYLD